MATNSIIEGVIKTHTKDVVRSCMRYRVQESLLEAQFLKMFNGDMMQN